jgi:hypothetical protein
VSLSNDNPPQYSEEAATIASNVPNSNLTMSKKYKTTTSYDYGATNAAGSATIDFNISGATIGYQVTVTVSVGAATCHAYFTPS